ncbi:MAG: hypothetical protein ABJM29_19465 [Rhizobiaceae bacterium]
MTLSFLDVWYTTLQVTEADPADQPGLKGINLVQGFEEAVTI